jgi:predicted transcriptional regulator
MESQEHKTINDLRRTRIDITADILRFANEGTKKTHLLYGCNLSYNQLQAYLKLLMDMGLLESRSDLFKTTSKGLKFLDAYRILATIMT